MKEKTKKDPARDWVLANAKVITKEEFSRRNGGMTFEYFHRTYKKQAIAEWNKFMSERSSEVRIEKRRENTLKAAHRICNCDYEKQQQANAWRVSDNTPQRLWHCNTHGNSFVDFSTPTGN